MPCWSQDTSNWRPAASQNAYNAKVTRTFQYKINNHTPSLDLLSCYTASDMASPFTFTSWQQRWQKVQAQHVIVTKHSLKYSLLNKIRFFWPDRLRDIVDDLMANHFKGLIVSAFDYYSLPYLLFTQWFRSGKWEGSLCSARLIMDVLSWLFSRKTPVPIYPLSSQGPRPCLWWTCNTWDLTSCHKCFPPSSAQILSSPCYHQLQHGPYRTCH